MAKNPRFRFFGNISVGEDVTVQDLLTRYDAVVLAYGAQGNKPLSGLTPGQSQRAFRGVHSAREFVNWYNGHPDYKNFSSIFKLNKVKNVVIVGNGNVALDCARILAKSVDALKTTDIADYALDELEKSTVQSISILGRRGPIQSSFTIKEFRELINLGPHVDVVTDSKSFSAGMSDPDSAAKYNSNRPVKRLVDLIASTQRNAKEIVSQNKETSLQKKTIVFRYLLSPIALLSTKSPFVNYHGRIVPSLSTAVGANDVDTFDDKSVTTIAEAVAADCSSMPSDIPADIGAIVCSVNEMTKNEAVRAIPAVNNFSGKSPLEQCLKLEVHLCDLILYAVGYQSEPLEGIDTDPASIIIPFDHMNHVVPNNQSRVEIPKEAFSRNLTHLPLLYAVGWIARGPSGVIATNVVDAKRTAEAILSDIKSKLSSASSHADSDSYLHECIRSKGKSVVTWSDYLKIEAEEINRGSTSVPARPLVKVTDVDEMIKVAHQS